MNNFKTTKIEANIDDVIPNPWNPNVMDKATFEKEKNSIKELGFLGSILVRDYIGRYQILDGEHRWKVAKELGYTKIQVETMGEIDDKLAQTLTILINNLRGKDDIFKRAAILKELEAGQLSLLPMTDEEIEHEKRFVEFDFGQYETVEEIPERDGSYLLVVPLNKEEAQVWEKAKELLIARGKLSENKKKGDLQLMMYLLKQFLDVYLGSVVGQKTHQIEVEVKQ